MATMTERLAEILKTHWGYDSFLPLQEEAMACALGGRDSLVVLPTGGGKSLCFQAPGLALPGVALVVSPLISLMKDQVDALGEAGAPAGRLDSSLSVEERRETLAALHRSELKLLYVSPERVLSPDFLDRMVGVSVSLVAIDEAHCVSMWGHDFRPEYRGLRKLRDAFPEASMHAYTATATDHVRKDIVEQLGLRDPEVLVGSFDRPNLVYSVEPRGPGLGQVLEAIARHPKESGIVYCLRRADVDSVCETLRGHDLRAAPYHAGMDALSRKQNQDDFLAESVDIIVATVAFGMGIDKSNVRFVVHASMPKSLEHYQQESGRAGRDGLQAECCLFYSGADYGTWFGLMRGMPEPAARVARTKLNAMYEYCTSVGCRHRALVGYFGQNLERENCGACDVCLGMAAVMDDSLVTSQKILSCVLRLRERFGGDYTAMVLVGSKEQRILSNGHDRLTTYGLLKEFPKRVVRDWVTQLVAQGYLEKSGEYAVLRVTESGWRVLRGEETPRLPKPPERKKKERAKRQKSLVDSLEGVDRGLFEELRDLRRELAEARGVPPYVVFGDRALRDMARRLPRTTAEFMEVFGVG